MAFDPFLPPGRFPIPEGSSADAGCLAPDSPVPFQTIGAAIAHWAKAKGGVLALVGPGSEALTFSQLHSCVTSFAHGLAHAGLRREDRVGLLVPTGVTSGQLVVALASNITLVPVNPALTPHEMTELARISGLKAVVIPRWLETPARSAIGGLQLTVIEAVQQSNGTLSLELLTPAPEAPAALRAATASDVALVLRSSGTTGAPKLIPVTHRNLLAMAGKMGSGLWFNLTGDDRAACTLPLYYAAGLKTSLFVPLLLGASTAFPPAGRTSDIAEWVDVLKPTYLSVAPGSLNGILDRLRVCTRDFDAPSLRFVMCAAAYLPEDVRLAAQAQLRVPVLEFYGLSEAGVMAANPVPPGKVKPGTVGLPAPGELLIVDENRQTVANGAVGHIMISGPTVTPGTVVTEHSAPVDLRDGWLMTGDLGRIDRDGYLTIVGRVTEVINRGGEKVFPYEIEKAMLEHPSVLEAAAFGVPHARLGENVEAAVVLKPGRTLSEPDLKEFLAGRLAAYKLPRTLALVPSLPRGSTGKVLRSALREAHAARKRETEQPDRLLELELRDVWTRLLGTGDIGIDEDFFEKGGDSLLAAELLIEVEDFAGKPYPQSELTTFTIRHMADVLASGLAAERSLVTQVKSGSGIPLFFCHGDYVTRGMYAQKLAALLQEDRPVFLLHCYADRRTGSSIEEIAHAYLQAVLRLAPDSPVFVGGYCNGGLAAWHLAHLLRSQGVEVMELLLIETMSLNARPLLRRLPGLLQTAGSAAAGRAGTFLREEAMRPIWAWRRRWGGLTFRAARKKVLARLGRQPAPRRRGDVFELADETYLGIMARYAPLRLDIGVTCFIAEDGRHFETEPGAWRRLAGRVDAVRVPGTHHTVLITGRQALAVAIGDVMTRATARRLARAGQEGQEKGR